jgi:hypothetical protein
VPGRQRLVPELGPHRCGRLLEALLLVCKTEDDETDVEIVMIGFDKLKQKLCEAAPGSEEAARKIIEKFGMVPDERKARRKMRATTSSPCSRISSHMPWRPSLSKAADSARNLRARERASSEELQRTFIGDESDS